MFSANPTSSLSTLPPRILLHSNRLCSLPPHTLFAPPLVGFHILDAHTVSLSHEHDRMPVIRRRQDVVLVVVYKGHLKHMVEGLRLMHIH